MEALDFKQHSVIVEHNGDLIISEGKSRFETSWKNKKVKWSSLLSRLSKSRETPETHAEYMALGKSEQDRIKDIGGFVGGHLNEGLRRTGYVQARQILTLDLDFAPADFWEQLMNNLSLECAMAVYSTHKHSEKTPRFRLIIPLDRPVSADEYEAIARKVAEKIGIEWFDDTTYQPTRLMYWPSNCADVKPVFKYYDAPFLTSSDILSEYDNWKDVSYWPMSSREKEVHRKIAEKQQNPLDKKNIVGLFCRTYSISQAIEKFLPDVYLATSKGDRYTYANGSTFGGLVVYDDMFAYSNHSTDPAAGQDCNAFDLVRIHKFGDLDIEGSQSGAKAPSYKAMAHFASEDDEVKIRQSDESAERAALDFAEDAAGEDWRTKLKRDKNAQVVPEATNALLIMLKDENLQGIRMNAMTKRIEAEGLPWERPDKYWRDVDNDQLYMWVSATYGVQFPDNKFYKALNTAADKRRFHPIKDYLDGLPEWDGIERAESLLIDYLGAEDNLYVREVTRKTLTAAVARIYEPGVKFDYVLVLVGPQGKGKSTLFSRLAGEWFGDALTLTDMKDKTGAELIQTSWIMELGEMTGMRKADIEAVKSFVSRQIDTYRPAYGRVVESRPRQCVIVGSTNSEGGFLRDVTGNRRFWPVKVSGEGIAKPWSLTPEVVAQIWAEVKANYELGEDLFLTGEVAKMSIDAQTDAMETDERQGIVEEYLERLLPANWDELDLDKRLLFLHGEEGEGEGVSPRQSVSNIEIWTECFGKRKEDMQAKDSYAITAIMAKVRGWERVSAQKRVPNYGKQRVYKRVKG